MGRAIPFRPGLFLQVPGVRGLGVGAIYMCRGLDSVKALEAPGLALSAACFFFLVF